MTHEELLKEMYEVCSFLIKKHEELETKYGDCPDFENKSDSWAFGILESLCGIKNINCMKEFDSLSGYRKTVSEFEYRTGDGVRKAMETGILNFK